MIYNVKYAIIRIIQNPMFIFIVILCYNFYTMDVNLCDDNLANALDATHFETDNGSSANNNSNSYNNSIDRNEVNNYPRHNRNSGLQYTSEGYRYEVSDNQINRSYDLPPSYERHIDESFYRDSNGREYGWKEGVDYPNRSPSESFYRDSSGREYGWKEGMSYPSPPQTTNSTQIGVIGSNDSIDRTPADLIHRSEMLSKTKTYYGKDYKEGESMGLRIINRIGRSLDKHIAKGSPEAKEASRRQSEKLMKDIRRTQSKANAHRAKRVNDMMKYTSKTVKVNRFD